ncbi:MAG: VapC toxin family PIN domain ribonuclease, partial [Candidatus Dormibacteraeota bacterium]|nr:VapC toxin family PIN domain ribonuclease [Candidatus Dormibacteraeota bacterium]
MIAIDTNLLVYAHRRDADLHGPAARRVADLAEGMTAWAIPWPCIHEFLAIVTHPRVYTPPSTLAQALVQVDA